MIKDFTIQPTITINENVKNSENYEHELNSKLCINPLIDNIEFCFNISNGSQNIGCNKNCKCVSDRGSTTEFNCLNENFSQCLNLLTTNYVNSIENNIKMNNSKINELKKLVQEDFCKRRDTQNMCEKIKNDISVHDQKYNSFDNSINGWYRKKRLSNTFKTFKDNIKIKKQLSVESFKTDIINEQKQIEEAIMKVQNEIKIALDEKNEIIKSTQKIIQQGVNILHSETLNVLQDKQMY